MMKLSKQTIQILKNFAKINDSIIIYPGSLIRSRTNDNYIIGEYECDEVFEGELSIYDLHRFLNSLKLIGPEPHISFVEEDTVVHITDNKTHKIRYGLTPKSMVPDMDKGITKFNPVVSFDLSEETIDKIHRAASALNVEHMRVSNIPENDGSLIIKVHQLEGEGTGSKRTTDFYDIDIGTVKSDETFSFVFDISSLPTYPGSYKVSMAESVISKFEHQDIPLTYWVAMRDESKYGSNAGTEI